MDYINFFAETNFRNDRKKFGIKPDDRRRHVYVIGKTGMGKTAMLQNMAIQDIQEGRGVGFVDPHGEAAEELLDFIPTERINDVVYLNPADLDWPLAFIQEFFPHCNSSRLFPFFLFSFKKNKRKGSN